MRWLSRVITLALIIGGIVTIGWIVVGEVGRRQVGGKFHTWAMFRDASLLPVGSRVVIAGVQVGQIDELAIDGRLARVSMRLQDDVELWDDAWAEKKVASAFGDGYIEIFPGGPGPGRRRLQSGEPLPRVVEGPSVDRTLRELETAMPRAQGALNDATELLVLARRQVAGPLTTRLDELDRAVRSGDLGKPLRDADEAMTAFDDWTAGAAETTATALPDLDRQLDEAAVAIADATVSIRERNRDLQTALGDVRTGLDDVDPLIADTAAVLARLDGSEPPEDRGTLATLINDPELGDQIADAAEGAEEFVHGLSRLETFIGLRAEFNVLARQPRFYVTAEVAGRRDTFYLVEAEKGPLGDVPEVKLTQVAGTDTWTRSAVIYERLRFTAQWGKRFGATAVRFGLKESTFGVGADAVLLGGRLKLSSDLYGPSFSRVPRFKLAAALEVFESIYVLMGVDDVLHAGGELTINAPGEVPTQFEKLRYGRDGFLGLMLRFDEEDLNSMLTIYGAAILSLL